MVVIHADWVVAPTNGSTAGIVNRIDPVERGKKEKSTSDRVCKIGKRLGQITREGAQVFTTASISTFLQTPFRGNLPTLIRKPRHMEPTSAAGGGSTPGTRTLPTPARTGLYLILAGARLS